MGDTGPQVVIDQYTVALFADRWILPGLHVTLLSLLEHASPDRPLRIVVFAERLTPREKALLENTAAPFLAGHRLDIRDFIVPVESGMQSLRGNFTTYGRFHLPELLPDAGACLYLDCDLIVTCEIADLFSLLGSGHPLYADGTGIRSSSIDHAMFQRLGMNTAWPYFNCGVLLLNLDQWRLRGIAERCRAFVRANGSLLRSADQSVLNAVLGEEFSPFDERFNTAVWPSSPAVPGAERHGRIFHLVGAPKPWDYFGRFTHRNFPFWQDVAKRTAWFADRWSRVAIHFGFSQRLRIMPATLRELRARYL